MYLPPGRARGPAQPKSGRPAADVTTWYKDSELATKDFRGEISEAQGSIACEKGAVECVIVAVIASFCELGYVTVVLRSGRGPSTAKLLEEVKKDDNKLESVPSTEVADISA